MEAYVGSWIYKDDDEETSSSAIARAQAALEEALVVDHNAD